MDYAKLTNEEIDRMVAHAGLHIAGLGDLSCSIEAAIREARVAAMEEAAKIADGVSTGCIEMHKRGTSCAEHMANTAQSIAIKIRERIAKVRGA